jgi:hypothetical protein
MSPTRFGVLASITVMVLAACGNAPPPAPTRATPSASPTASPSPTPEVLQLDGTWSGSTAGGDDFGFTVSGNEINDVKIPGAKCGVGLSSTVNQEGGFNFKGSKFKVSTIGLTYMVYPKGGGAAVPGHDSSIITGRFTSSTDAEGEIVTKVQSDSTTVEQCKQKWTATKD